MPVTWRGSPEGLEPGFLADVDRLLAGSPFHWYVLQGYRTLAESARLYEAYRTGKGPRAAPPGQSAHNFGLAVDVVLDLDSEKPGLQPGYDTRLAGWLWLKAAILPHPRLSSGARFNDWPHIERFRWRRYKDWRKA